MRGVRTHVRRCLLQVASAVQSAVLTTNQGMPIIVNQRSSVMTEWDGYKGVKSCDPRLQTSIDECLLFFNTYNTRPNQAVRVHGYHRERRTRQVSYQDDNGGTHYRTETYVNCLYAAGQVRRRKCVWGSFF